MSKLSKFKDILGIATAVAKPFVPGAAGSVLEAVNGHLNKGGLSGELPEAIKRLGEDNDEQTQAILALHERNEDQERRLKAIEAKLGI